MSRFALGIRYLNGWAMAASDGAKKEQAEWPPHPDRVFMALAAALFETGIDADEMAALQWLESLPPPSLFASGAEERHVAGNSTPATHFVPVNDSARGKKPPSKPGLDALRDAGLCLLPEHRLRQPRSFPVAIPYSDSVFLIWDHGMPEALRDAMASLAAKVTHVGHSASFVQVWVEASPPSPNWIPSNGIAVRRMRVWSTGRLQDLERGANFGEVREYAMLQQLAQQKQGSERKAVNAQIAQRFHDTVPVSRRPEPQRWQGYAQPRVTETNFAASSVFDPHFVVLAFHGRKLPLTATMNFIETLRGAVHSLCADPLPEWVSGHRADGSATALPHLALIPLGFVASAHADGRVLGVGLVLPKEVDTINANAVLDPLLFEPSGTPRRIKLYDGQWLECELSLELRESPPKNLLTGTWTGPSRVWATATPIALDRFFDGADKWERAAESVKLSCERIGLPRPTQVLLSPVSILEGVPPSREFPMRVRKSDGGRLPHTHAVLMFDEEVSGPVLLGAGRFRGYGLCRPAGGHDHE